MDSSALASAETWLSVLGIAKLVAAFLVAIGVVIEFGGDWVARPYENVVKEAREAEVRALNNETAQLSAEAEAAKSEIAKASAEVAKANERTEALRKQNLDMETLLSPRILEQNLTAEKLKQFADVAFLVVSPTDFEPRRTAGQIRFMLEHAGWKKFRGKIAVSPGYFGGIVVHPLLKLDRKREMEAADALVSIFKQNNIAAQIGAPMPRANENGEIILPVMRPQDEAGLTDAIFIEVGPKPLPTSMELKPENVPSDSRGNKMYGNISEE
jgi:outer membrane murein-binding lipoprotein Lpp